MIAAAPASRAGVQHKLLWRLAPSLAGLLVYAGFVLIRQYHFELYQALLAAFDTLPNVRPYGDMNAVLSALSCARLGVNVYVPNGCMHGGVYNYSSFLLHAAVMFPIGPGPGIRLAAGLLTGALVLGVVALLPPARSRWELALRIAAMGSSTLVDMLESANIDNLLFVATICAVLALRHGLLGRVFGYGVCALLAAIKFYPVVLFALLAREGRGLIWAVCFIGVGLAGVYGWYFGAGFVSALEILPGGPPYNYMFGAHNLAAGFAVMFGVPQSSLVAPTTTILVALALLVAWRTAAGYGAALLAIGEAERLLLLAGAAIIAECFFMAQNYDYRGAFFLLTLPGLCAMARAMKPLERTFNGAALAVLFLLWEPLARFFVAALARAMPGDGGVGLKMAFWLLREFVWWRVCIFLAALVFAYLAARLPVLWQVRRTA